jgi:protein dithiol oxidoreductase (disulfide-forming)
VRRFLVLGLALVLSLGACSRTGSPPPGSSQAAGGNTSAETHGSPAAEASADQTANPSLANAGSGPASAPVAADGSDDAPVGTTSLEKIAELPAQHQLPDGKWKPGVNYDPVVPAQPTAAPAGKVEVLEIFWYGCPHCYDLEPYLAAWRKSKPDYIQFERVPVMWGPVHRAHAQLYYTLKQLGRNDLDQKVFDTLHNEQNPLVGNTPEETFALQLQFAKDMGIDPESFRKAYNSFAVNSDLQRAEVITQRYQVEGVPVIEINGKYTTDVGKAGSHENLIAEINDLAAAEHRH